MFLLHSKEKPNGVPDYLGQCIDETGENLFEALLQKKVELVPRLFAPYLIGALNLFERMKPANPKPDVWTQQKMQIAVAPILDLELSGYAKLLADLNGEEKLWTMIAGHCRYLDEASLSAARPPTMAFARYFCRYSAFSNSASWIQARRVVHSGSTQAG
jgi:hypothetical protein